jgi:hypothetical protein
MMVLGEFIFVFLPTEPDQSRVYTNSEKRIRFERKKKQFGKYIRIFAKRIIFS